ncbi:hypothetical protein ATO7_02825 [Oceanococcus atlanticus]|uniref:Ribbon-helix-helix protein CopG domain-containing protein n=1 Tax=Oceanococcus atlanticus TaxID=1317117 RepID=A0A1Y1SGH1_9GAMM|nr:hypothetical protein [Oceanococcus atlanticus]ORE88774.1 hypothetical protein ATO7_02825 [Oceanococcus atlanticus]
MGKKTQIACWAYPDLLENVDAKREELSSELGFIPTRSDIMRAALENYLEMDVTAYDKDTSARSIAQRKRWARERGEE